MARHPKGSHPTLTDQLISELSAAIRRGVYVETACALCGISKDTFYRWLREAKGEDATPETLKLSDAVEKALAESEVHLLSVIDAAADGGQWQAAAWRLERRFPEKWGRQGRLQVEHSGPGGIPIQVDDRRERMLKLLENADDNVLSAVEAIEGRLRED